MTWTRWIIDRVKIQQQNWIGEATARFVNFAVKDHAGDTLRVYTTRADTLFGVTYMVIAPEHPIIQKYRDSIANIAESWMPIRQSPPGRASSSGHS